MSALRTIRALGPIDMRNVARDSMMRWFVLLPVGLALLMRWATPAIAESLDTRYGFDLTPYYPLIASLMVMVTPGIMGAVIGFLLLDQRDDETLSALQVTPLTATGFLAYRLSLPTLLSIALTMIVVAIVDLATVSVQQLFVVSLLAAPLAPLYALLLPAFANNKIQGFALMKAAGIVNWPPIAAWFLPEIWHWPLGIAPTLWPAKLFWMFAGAGGTSPAWPVFAVGFAWQLLLGWLLLKRFQRVVYS